MNTLAAARPTKPQELMAATSARPSFRALHLNPAVRVSDCHLVTIAWSSQVGPLAIVLA